MIKMLKFCILVFDVGEKKKVYEVVSMLDYVIPDIVYCIYRLLGSNMLLSTFIMSH